MSSIIFEVKDQVGYIKLNRPEKMNAFNLEMALALQSALDECADTGVRAVYLTGSGKAFSAGQDLAEVVSPGGPGIGEILAEQYNPVIKKIAALRKPVVAAING